MHSLFNVHSFSLDPACPPAAPEQEGYPDDGYDEDPSMPPGPPGPSRRYAGADKRLGQCVTDSKSEGQEQLIYLWLCLKALCLPVLCVICLCSARLKKQHAQQPAALRV